MDERVEAVESRRQLIVSEAEDSCELVRPSARIRPHVPFPASEIGELLRFLQLHLARAQSFVLPPPLGDVVRHRDHVRHTTLRIVHGAAMALDPRTSPLGRRKRNSTSRFWPSRTVSKNAFSTRSLSSDEFPETHRTHEILFVSEQPGVAGFA